MRALGTLIPYGPENGEQDTPGHDLPDHKYYNHELDRWTETNAEYVHVVRRPPDAKGIVLLSQRWLPNARLRGRAEVDA